MRLGVLSDTHMASVADGERLAARLLTGPFASVDAILHAGDVGSPDWLLALAPVPVYAVAGNTDTPGADLPLQRVLRLEGLRLGLTHGWGAPDEVVRNVCRAYADEMLHGLVFGHSHHPYCQRRGEMLCFNPGSPSRDRSGQGPTVGLLAWDGRRLSGQILQLK